MEILLAIESSCDETAAAVIARDRSVLSNVIASQSALHEEFGGVVPEIASRAHVRRIVPVVDQALRDADVSLSDLAAIAVVNEPGLVGSLLVGVSAAKALSLALGVPLIAVNHIEAHLYACAMSCSTAVFPAVGLVVSGGHTNLYDCVSSAEHRLIGSTIDDAAGEAFDKVAKILGLSYPGGPAIDRAAANGNPQAERFPRTFLKEDRLEFSFSGLKTAVKYAARGVPNSNKPAPPLDESRIADLAASFRAAVVDVLVGKCEQALEKTGRDSLCVGGGVAANRLLRTSLEAMCRRRGAQLTIAPMEMCTDNAAMAGLAWESFERGEFAGLDLEVNPGLVRKPR